MQRGKNLMKKLFLKLVGYNELHYIFSQSFSLLPTSETIGL